ncbi:FecCD family ABC transporter permease [Nocardioides alcanivorans]|uniref:FecCD family ABC transporter permease n=1 Tax=Nocardioides alcanivorans TaxID=2897352 RepID=UPI001F44E975|nr:iron ABC transporter permease [Nocardioides alcanivorans]
MADRRLPAPLLLALGLVVLVGAAGLSIFFGSHSIAPKETWRLLWHPDDSVLSGVIHEQRIPRTVLTAAVGASLGLAGALMQALTRNPLAEPGILGINAGASLAVVLAVAIAGVAGIWFYLWFAFLGAAVTAVGVYFLAGVGRASATPVRLALAGVAVSAAMTALVQTVILADQVAFNEFRFWVVGSTEGRGWPVLGAVAPFLLVGAALALLLGPALNAMALGDDTAQGLGVKLGRIRTGTMISATLLCGAATAAVGPIAFVGLAVPLAARALAGHDQRWISVLSIVLGGAWLLSADVLSRVVIAPQEVQVGVVAAILGAPIFVAMVSRRKVVSL